MMQKGSVYILPGPINFWLSCYTEVHGEAQSFTEEREWNIPFVNNFNRDFVRQSNLFCSFMS